jgi:hypothetical protein
MPNFTKSLISLAFLNPRLFYKAKNQLVFKHFICNTLDLNNLQFDGCGTILCSNYISRVSGSITFDTVKIENLAIRTIVQDSGTTSARSMVNIEGSRTTGGIPGAQGQTGRPGRDDLESARRETGRRAGTTPAETGGD